MGDCCSSSDSQHGKHPKKSPCPVNGIECSEVSARTIAHHIKEAWTWEATAVRYFFCDDPQRHPKSLLGSFVITLCFQ